METQFNENFEVLIDTHFCIVLFQTSNYAVQTLVMNRIFRLKRTNPVAFRIGVHADAIPRQMH